MAYQQDPFSAYTDHAEFYDLPDSDLERILPPFAAGLVMAAGRALAVLAYRDAAAYGDRPFDRHSPEAADTVLALLPPACDSQDRAFRAGAARALWDLADDIADGLAPLPRCSAEQWALEAMLHTAPVMSAATDEELHALGVVVPGEPNEKSYRPPYWEEAWQLVIEGAEFSIPEARSPAGDDEDDDREPPAEPEGGWDGPAYWFSPFDIATPRPRDRGHPVWAQLHLDGRPLTAPAPLTADRSSSLLRLREAITAGEGTGPDDPRERYFGRERDDVLTPLAARILATAADHLVEQGWHDLFEHGDRVFEREDDEYGDLDDTFLGSLPPLCDGQGAAWRLAMIHAVKNLADDLRAGQAPNPSCTAEELAFHLIVGKADELTDLLDDEHYAADLGLPPLDRISVRHRTFDRYLDLYLQDWDVLMHYDDDLRHVAEDPESPVSQHLGTGDLRPRAWFETFGNVPARTPREVEPWLAERIAAADPELFFASTPALTAEHPAAPDTPGTKTPDIPDGLLEEYETFVGLAQHRFFDQPCAIAMAQSLERLLTRFLATPALVPGRLWPLNPRATAVKAGYLLVDHDFQLQGLTKTWRLAADRTDKQARTWATALLQDCANYALAHHGRTDFALFHDPDQPPPPPLDPSLPAILQARLAVLDRDLTTAGQLRHRADHLGLTPARLAQAALLPEPLITGWLNGEPPSPSLLIRCAPVLQVSEDVLLEALGGKRDTGYWPLPTAADDRAGRPAPGA
ncbi:hypothetical protein ACWDRR_22700 [Kitasatospora sp. NPDC003701]